MSSTLIERVAFECRTPASSSSRDVVKVGPGVVLEPHWVAAPKPLLESGDAARVSAAYERICPGLVVPWHRQDAVVCCGVATGVFYPDRDRW
jgi:hypothetical protein